MNRILIVDDEPLIRYSLEAALKGRDTEVIAMPDGRTALKALGDWRFDICFLDIQLPDANGVDLLGMIRELAPRTKVVIMTGSTVAPDVMQAIRQKAFLFLSKPFDLFRVKRVLDALPKNEENSFQEFDELETRVAAERRKHRREAAAAFKQVSYVTLAPDRGPGEQMADLLDISDAGTRIRTASPLEPGSLIRFKSSMKEASGVVRWSTVDERTSQCLAGVQFIEKAG